jgi:hypothetical protein
VEREITPMCIRQTSPITQPDAATSELFLSTQSARPLGSIGLFAGLDDIEVYFGCLFKSEHHE